MRVFGYNENKEVIEVELARETVATKQIDPFRLDLFDPNPVTHEVRKGQRLYFRKLSDIAFGYVDNNKAHICVHVDGSTVCLESRSYSRNGRNSMLLNNPRTNKRPFLKHFLRFLELGGNFPGTGSALGQLLPASYATSSESVELAGAQVSLRNDDSKFTNPDFPVFCGEMFGTLAFAHALPAKINWVFENLAELQPLVLAQTITDILVGATPSCVHLCVNESDKLQNIGDGTERGYFKEIGGFGTKFCLSENVYLAKPHSPAEVLKEIAQPGQLDTAVYSCRGVYATGVNRVHATRMALYDIARRKFRSVSQNAHVLINKLHGTHKTERNVPSGFSTEKIRLIDQTPCQAGYLCRGDSLTMYPTPWVLEREFRALAA